MSALLDRLERLEREATPGPWIRNGGTWRTPVGYHPANWINDSALIAEARNALPKLLAVARAARTAAQSAYQDIPSWPEGCTACADDELPETGHAEDCPLRPHEDVLSLLAALDAEAPE